MNDFPQYGRDAQPPAVLDNYLRPDPRPLVKARPRWQTVARKALLLPLGAAGVVALAGWATWSGLTSIGSDGDAAPVVSAARPTAEPGPAVPQPRHTEYAPPVPTVVTEDGMYFVGKQIKPGTYRATCDAKITCVWQRYRVVDGTATAVAGGTALPGESVLVELSTADFSFGVLGFGEWTLQ